MSSRIDKKHAARERVAAMRREQQGRERRQRFAWITGIGLVVAVLVAVGAWGITRADKPATLPPVKAASGTALPPWPLPADPAGKAKAAGLRVAAMEGTARHFHVHLDVIANGEPVTVPADIGIDASGLAMSELHTHDASGLVHIEAPTAGARYRLGQLFTEWNVRLSAQGIGGLTTNATNVLRSYVNGKQVAGDPSQIELLPHREIALVYGPATVKVTIPATYKFAPGE